MLCLKLKPWLQLQLYLELSTKQSAASAELKGARPSYKFLLDHLAIFFSAILQIFA
jgi:hypothetical protein